MARGAWVQTVEKGAWLQTVVMGGIETTRGNRCEEALKNRAVTMNCGKVALVIPYIVVYESPCIPVWGFLSKFAWGSREAKVLLRSPPPIDFYHL